MCVTKGRHRPAGAVSTCTVQLAFVLVLYKATFMQLLQHLSRDNTIHVSVETNAIRQTTRHTHKYFNLTFMTC